MTRLSMKCSAPARHRDRGLLEWMALLLTCMLSLFPVSAGANENTTAEATPFAMSVYLYRSEGPFPTLDPVIGLGQVAGLPFEKLNDSHFNLGFTIDRVWVKVRITNLSHASQSRMRRCAAW